MIRWLAFASLALLAGCGDDAVEGGSGVPGVTDTEIVLGSHSDLSSSVAIWGVGSINGVRLRFEEANAAGGVHGRQIRFIVEDNQYQIARAIQAANKLINRDRIFAMVMALGTPMNNAVLSTQLAAGVPNFFPLTGARSMAEPYHPLKFTQRGIYYDEIRAGVKYFIERAGKTGPCVIHQDTEYGEETLQAAQDQLAEMGRELLAVSAHRPTETEFTAAILRLQQAGCDAVFMGTIHKDTVGVMRTARNLGFGAVFVGNNATYGQVIAEEPAAEGYHAFIHQAKLYPDDEMSPAVRAWWRKYVARFDVEPGVPAMEGYRGADLVVEALERAGRELSREAFIAAMESIDDYEDVFGYRIAFAKGDHNGVKESTLSVVRDGRWRTLASRVSY